MEEMALSQRIQTPRHKPKKEKEKETNRGAITLNVQKYPTINV